MKNQSNEKYPEWICHECAIKNMTRPLNPNQQSTYHFDVCGVCGQLKSCTEPRDYGFPKVSRFESNFKLRLEFKDGSEPMEFDNCANVAPTEPILTWMGVKDWKLLTP